MKYIKIYEELNFDFEEVWEEEPCKFEIDDINDIEYIIISNNTNISIYYKNNDSLFLQLFTTHSFLSKFKNEISYIPDIHGCIYYKYNIKNEFFRVFSTDSNLEIRLNKLFEKMNELYDKKIKCDDDKINHIANLIRSHKHLIYINLHKKTNNCDWKINEKLPKLPKSLEKLNCRNTKISELPELPKSLNTLNCKNTNISNQFLYKEWLIDYCKKNNIELYI